MDTRELIERLKVQVEIGLLGAAELHGFKVASYDECAGALSSQAAEIERLREALDTATGHIRDLAAMLELFKDQWPGWDYDQVISISHWDATEFLASIADNPNEAALPNAAAEAAEHHRDNAVRMWSEEHEKRISAEAEAKALREALTSLDDMIGRNLRDNGTDVNRMRLDGEWHTGPVVDALFRILRGVQDIARVALIPKPNKEG